MHSLRLAPIAGSLVLLLGCADAASAGPGGLVSLTQIDSAGATQQVLFGLFTDTSLEALRRGELAGCTVQEEVGACRRFACEPASGSTYDAGELRVTGGPGAPSLSAALHEGQAAYTALAPGVPLLPGEVVTFEASGGAVPAFTADVVVPRPPTVTLPPSIARRAPLTIEWSDTDAGTMQIGIVSSAGGAIVRCLVAGSAGTLTVDPALLDDFAAGTPVVLTTSAFASTEVTAGGYALDVSVAHGTTATSIVE